MKIKLYKLDKCGYYKRGSKVPEYGLITEWWEEFKQWFENCATTADTATFTDKTAVTTEIFCTNVADDPEGNFGVTLWNRSPRTEAGIGYIQIDKPPSEVVVGERSLPNLASTPGWPTYLWYMPDQNVIASLIPENILSFVNPGIRQARSYFYHYLRSHSSTHVDKETVSEGDAEAVVEVKGFRKTKLDESSFDVKPYFETSLWYASGIPENILRKPEEISKLVTEAPLNKLQPSATSRLDRLIAFPRTRLQDHPEDDRIKYRVFVDWKPSKQDVVDLIDDWNASDDKDNYSIGVRFKGNSSKIEWLGRVDGKGSLEIPSELSKKRLWKDEEVKIAWEQARPEIKNLLRANE